MKFIIFTILIFLTSQLHSDIKQGEKVFNLYCASCHGHEGAGALAPNLTDLEVIYGTEKNDIIKVITHGVLEKGMPAWGISLKSDEISDAADYVKSIMGKNLKPKEKSNLKARYAVYYPIHFIGIFLLFMCTGAMCIHVRNGGSKEDNNSRKLLAITHGVALLLVIVGGMGLMKATGASSNGFPLWIIIKLIIWLILGASTLIIYKLPKLSTLFFFAFTGLGILAALTAKFKVLSSFLGSFN